MIGRMMPMSGESRFMALVRSFPVLANYAPLASSVAHVSPLLDLLDAWASHDEERMSEVIAAGGSPFPGQAAQQAAAFFLNLWASDVAWKVGKFDLFRALVVWDDQQRRAFQAWAANPWRP